ncbi:MAG: SRPBCC family protein [Caldilineaceae bacterium]
MNPSFDPTHDLTITRVIKAPRTALWRAWSEPARFAQWWVPAPAQCNVVAMELNPGGAFVTQIREDEGDFQPHLNGCFLAVDPAERIVFTTCLVGGWRPAEEPFITAVIRFVDHPLGTEYVAHVMHKNTSDRNTHETLGFYEGWGTVIEQLATLVERDSA